MITIIVTNRLEVGPLDRLPAPVLRQIKVRLTFENPRFVENERRGFSNWNVPPQIVGYQVDGDRLIILRGFARPLLQILQGAGVLFRVDDRRRSLPEVDFEFQGTLKDFQQEAIEAMDSRDFGTLSAPTGSGKTVMALALVARRRQPALIVVHTAELLRQWQERVQTFLAIPKAEIGQIGAGKVKVGDRISIGMVQTLAKVAREVAPHIGFLIIDEAHHCASKIFSEVVSHFNCQYMTGLSATLYRRDKLTRLIYWYLGDRVHEINKAALVDARHVLAATVTWRKTDFEPTYDTSEEYSKMLRELCEDQSRNALIIQDVAREANGGGVILILSDRKSHCHTLVDLLAARGIEAALLTGDLRPKARQQVVEDLNAGRVKVLAATGALCGEGFDCRELSTLFLATPIRFSGRLLQYLGRVLRPAPGKEQATVYDFVDVNVPVLVHAARCRATVYGI